MKTLIAVLTYQRESQLRDCLSSIRLSALSYGADVQVVIGDNDPDSFSSEAYIVEARRLNLGLESVAAGRQALLEYARSNHFDYLAFIDDDELVSPGWLRLMLATSSRYDCGAVAGPVSPCGLPPSLEPLYRRARRPTGTLVASAGAGNLLVDLRRVKMTNFNTTWPLSGGEDTDFTMRLALNEGPIVWCDEADVYEPVSRDRRSKVWLFRRYFNNGRILRYAWNGVNPGDANSSILRRLAAAAACLAVLPASLGSPKLMRVVLDHGARNLGYIYQVFKH